MFFDNTTDPDVRAAIERAHRERGKIFGEIRDWLLRRN